MKACARLVSVPECGPVSVRSHLASDGGLDRRAPLCWPRAQCVAEVSSPPCFCCLCPPVAGIIGLCRHRRLSLHLDWAASPPHCGHEGSFLEVSPSATYVPSTMNEQNIMKCWFPKFLATLTSLDIPALTLSWVYWGCSASWEVQSPHCLSLAVSQPEGAILFRSLLQGWGLASKELLLVSTSGRRL